MAFRGGMIISYRRTIGKVKCLRGDMITDLPKAIHQFGCCCNRNSGGLTPEAGPPEFRLTPEAGPPEFPSCPTGIRLPTHQYLFHSMNS